MSVKIKVALWDDKCILFLKRVGALIFNLSKDRDASQKTGAFACGAIRTEAHWKVGKEWRDHFYWKSMPFKKIMY